MKRFFRYLYDCRYMCIWFLFSGLIFAIVFSLYDMELGAIFYPLLITGIVGICFLCYRYKKREDKYRHLIELEQSGRLYSESFPAPDCLTEDVYQQLFRKEEEAHRAEREEWLEARRDMNDYYATWVHQIKAPIAVMRVLLQQQDTAENRELQGELFRVEQYAEMALSYIRLGEDASDLLIAQYDLDEMIRKCVRKYAGQFIRKKLRIIYEGTSICVLTDEKWLSFIIEQLLSNAVKYTATGSVTIRVDEEKKVVSIIDTGIGISSEDLPRIFEKGYTGYNGRLDKKSTGIGLYLCKTAADKLGHKMSAESVLGEGSTFKIDLSSYKLIVE